MMGLESFGRIDGAAFVLGIGCERGACPHGVIELAERALALCAADRSALSALASVETRATEPAVLAAAAHFNISLRVFDVEVLEAQTGRLLTPSERVFALTGCHGVAEAAALAASGETGRLVVPKIKSSHATAAVSVFFPYLNQSDTRFSFQETLLFEPDVGARPQSPQRRTEAT